MSDIVEDEDWTPSVVLQTYHNRGVLRNIGLGIQNCILIEPNEETGNFEVHLSLGELEIEDAQGLLEYVAEAIKQGIEDGQFDVPDDHGEGKS